MTSKAREMMSLYRRLQDIVFSLNREESDCLDEAGLMIAGNIWLMRHILDKEDNAVFSELIVILSEFAHRVRPAVGNAE